MELRHLRYFAMVANERSFRRAAEKLHIAQPPLSRQIQQLEAELGVRLLDRGRPLTLTTPGRYLLESAQDLLQRVEQMRVMTRRLDKEKSAKLRIGFVASTLYDELPELIRRFRLTAPNVEVTLSELTTSEQIFALKDGRIDVAFGRLHVDDPLISQKVIRVERIIIALPRRHVLAQRKSPVKLRDVVNEPVILDFRAPKPNYADVILGYYRERGLAPASVLEVRDLQTALGLVASEAGVALVPASARRVGRDDVTFLDVDEANMIAPVIMCQRLREKSSELSHLRKLIRKFNDWRAP